MKHRINDDSDRPWSAGHQGGPLLSRRSYNDLVALGSLVPGDYGKAWPTMIGTLLKGGTRRSSPTSAGLGKRHTSFLKLAHEGGPRNAQS